MQIFIYFTALFAFVFLAALLVRVLRKKGKNSLQYLLILYIIAVMGWILFLFFEDASRRLGNLQAAWILERGKYFFITLVPIWILFMSHAFAQDGKYLTKSAYLVMADPVITQFGLWTDNRFHLYYSSLFVRGRAIGLLSAAHIMIFFTVMAVALVYLVLFMRKASKELHFQALLLIVCTALPVFVNILFIANTINITPYATPIVFAASAFAFYKTVSKYNFLENTPLVLRSIVDRISYVYIVVDAELTIVDFNEPAFQAFPSHKLKKGNNFSDIINTYKSIFDYDKILNCIAEARRIEKPVKAEIIYHPTEHNNTDRFFQCEFTPIFQKGRYRACIVMGQDVTQSKKDYASFVEQERLSSIAQMIGSVVQNLRAPVLRLSNSMENIASIIDECQKQIDEKSITPDEFVEIIREIKQNLQSQRSGLESFEGILSAITMQTESLIVENDKVFSLPELITRVEFLLKDKLDESQCTLKTTNNCGSEVRIKGDMNSLVQIIQALIMNSIQAYNGAEGLIYFTLAQKKDLVTISIGDYAGGIPLEMQDKLFKQVVTTKGKHSSGISLYMAHATIIGHFQGKMWFTSKQNEGSEFFIEIPLINADTDLEIPEQPLS
ncbi:MAG: hypothetical protein IKK38_11215 [Spirochaetaceae bacterium]|nr:hypothetical protein [Spirochaetaceae bacterium]